MKRLIPILILLVFQARSSAQVPIVSRPEPGRDVEMVVHGGFISCYNHETLQPDWVAWEISPDLVAVDGSSGAGRFSVDPAAKGPCSTPAGYERTGYVRAMMAPVQDFWKDADARADANYTTNACLQNRTLHERAWAELEARARYWTTIFYKTTVWVAAGPLFTTLSNKVGKDFMPVPAGFWKVFCRETESGFICIAFLFPNKPVSTSWREYAVSVDRVEELTGFDFFPGLVGEMDEASFDLKKWK